MPVLKDGLLGMGNPLLDVSCNVDQAFLVKYGVSPWSCYHQIKVTSTQPAAGSQEALLYHGADVRIRRLFNLLSQKPYTSAG